MCRASEEHCMIYTWYGLALHMSLGDENLTHEFSLRKQFHFNQKVVSQLNVKSRFWKLQWKFSEIKIKIVIQLDFSRLRKQSFQNGNSFSQNLKSSNKSSSILVTMKTTTTVKKVHRSITREAPMVIEKVNVWKMRLESLVIHELLEPSLLLY